MRVEAGPPRVGFTVSKQVGNAVERNRVRRRLREVVRLTGTPALRAGHDYVLVGRRNALAAPFDQMMADLDKALHRVHGAGQGHRGGTGSAGQRSLHEAGSSAAHKGPRRQPNQSTPKSPQ